MNVLPEIIPVGTFLQHVFDYFLIFFLLSVSFFSPIIYGFV